MKMDTDKVLEQVLRGLGDMQPSSGLEDRVLANVRARTLSPPPWHASLRQRAFQTFPLWSLTAGGLAVLAIASVFYMRHHVSPSDAAQVRPAQTAAPPASAMSATTALVYTSHEPASQRKKASAHTHGAFTPVHPSAATCDCDSLAMEEWRAPSQPAPELPLTHEERLLQGFAYRGNTEELAALTPAFRAAENAREQAEFQHFFRKPTNGDNE